MLIASAKLSSNTSLQKKAHITQPKAEVEESADLFSFDLDSGVDNIDFLDEPDDNRWNEAFIVAFLSFSFFIKNIRFFWCLQNQTLSSQRSTMSIYNGVICQSTELLMHIMQYARIMLKRGTYKNSLLFLGSRHCRWCNSIVLSWCPAVVLEKSMMF